MTKDLWINLPVKDINKSKEFFSRLGFSFKAEYSQSDVSAALTIGDKNVVVMLFDESVYKTFTNIPITDTSKFSEVLFSFDAESPAEVDEMAKKVVAAGGKIFGGPGERDGWMYGFGFSDLDGHCWNMLYMDISRMPK